MRSGRLDEQRRILDTTLADYEASLHLVRTLYNNGLASEEDLAEADTQLDRAEAQATDLGIARAQYEHAIAVLIGVAPAQFSVSVRPFDTALAADPGRAALRPARAQAGHRRRGAPGRGGQRRDRHRAGGLFPEPDPERAPRASRRPTSRKLLDWPNRLWSVGPSVAQPIFDGGTAPGRERAGPGALRRRRSRITGRPSWRRFQSVEDNLSSLRILSTEVTQQHKAAVAAKHTVELSVVRYQNGLDSYVNVITAQNTFLSNRLAELQVQLRQLTASVALVNNLGGGWDRSQLGETERMAQNPPGAGARPEPPAENAGPGVPNPAPLPEISKRPEDLLKQNEQDMAPAR